MAQYTTQIRTLLDNGVDLFDFDYPIFDEAYRTVLETKITDWYYYREIGLETVGMFKQFLKAKLNVIMPYYNHLYTTQKDYLTKDLFFNKNLTDTTSRTNTSDASGSSDGTEKMSDTPQGLNDGQDYLTELTTNSGSSTSKVTTTEKYTATSVGDDGMRYPASVYKEINDNFINIDKMIIDELANLFMNIY